MTTTTKPHAPEEIAIANGHGGEGVFEITQENSLFVPFGEYPHAKGLQKFDRESGEALLAAFNSLPAKVGRMFSGGVPIFAGHPDVPKRQDSNPAAPAYGWVQGVVVENDGVRLPVKWNTRGRESIENAEYRFYSPNWLLRKVSGGIQPVKLLSIGLTNHPRIPVPAIANDNQPKEKKTMNEEQLKAIGLEPGATDEQINARLEKLAAAENDATTEKARADKAEGELATAKQAVQEKETALQAANDTAARQREARIDGALETLVSTGRLTEADRPARRTELVAIENDEALDARLDELAKADPVLKTKPRTANLAQGKEKVAAENDAAARSEKRTEAVEAELARIANDVPAAERYDIAWTRAQKKHPELFSSAAG